MLAWPGGAAAGERILALAPHVCEMLYAVGAGREVVGRGDYCDYPVAAQALPDVGSARRIYVEQALRLHPTMAVVMDATTPGVAQLARAGVRIVESHPATIAAILDDMRRLGNITGHAVQGRQAADRLGRRVKAIAARVSGKRVSVFYELWPRPLMSVGGDSFIADVLHHAGLRNIFDKSSLESVRVGVESVLRARPGLVIVPQEKQSLTARRRFWRKWLGPKVRVIGMPADLFQRPGPRVVDGLELLVEKVGRSG